MTEHHGWPEISVVTPDHGSLTEMQDYPLLAQLKISARTSRDVFQDESHNKHQDQETSLQ